VAVGVVVLLILAAGGVALLGGDDGGDGDSDTATTDQTEGTDPETTDTDGAGDTTTTAVDLAAGCDRSRQVCITGVSFEGDDLVAAYETDLGLSLPTSPQSVHAHFYLSPNTIAETSGTQSATPGSWQIWATPGEYSARLQNVGVDGNPVTRAEIGANTELCVTVADENHQSDPSTEHCAPIPA
jgi:hypothetical protein